MIKSSIKKLCQLEHNDLEKDSQVSKDTFENEINKEYDKKEIPKRFTSY